MGREDGLESGELALDSSSTMWLGQVSESLSHTDTVRPGHGGDSKVWWFLLSKEMEQCLSVALGSRSRSLLTSVLASAVVPDPFSVTPGYLGGSLWLPVSPAPAAVSSVPPFMVESHLTSGMVTSICFYLSGRFSLLITHLWGASCVSLGGGHSSYRSAVWVSRRLPEVL